MQILFILGIILCKDACLRGLLRQAGASLQYFGYL